MEAPDYDLCNRCGNRFPEDQACESCRTPAETLRAAAFIIRRKSPGSLLVPWLEREAKRAEKAAEKAAEDRPAGDTGSAEP